MINHYKIILCLFLSLFCLNSLASDNKSYGGQSMVKPLKTVLVKRPDFEFASADPKLWHYTAKPNLKMAQKEHDQFVKILKSQGVKVVYQDHQTPQLADSIFVHDPVIMTDYGAVILSMGKELRKGEETILESKLSEMGVPVLFKLKGHATAEGGDMLWLDDSTLAVGNSFRTNREGIKQLSRGLARIGVKVVPVDLPYDQGRAACLHLQSLISLVSEDKAVVYRKLMPVRFVQLLEEKGFTLIDVSDDEYQTMGPNILAIKPNLVLTLEGNNQLKKKLESKGVMVLTYKGQEISHKAEGGATCLTRPILRG